MIKFNLLINFIAIRLVYSQNFQDFNPSIGPIYNSQRGLIGPIMPTNSFNNAGFGGRERFSGFERAQIHPFISHQNLQQQNFFHRRQPIPNDFLSELNQNQRYITQLPQRQIYFLKTINQNFTKN